jgi:hypothetical protein
MNYPAPDGHIITSSPTEPVVYTCPNNGWSVGTYENLETQSSNNAYGIEQIKVHRVITETEITITITESTDAELQAYLDSIQIQLSDTTINDLLN